MPIPPTSAVRRLLPSAITRARRPAGRRALWRRRVLRRALSAACLIAAALVVVRMLAPPPPPTEQVLVPVRDLEAGHLITDRDVEVRSRPSTASGPVLREVAGAIGRRLSIPVAREEPLTSTRFVPRSVDEGLPADSVALHIVVADPRSLDLVGPGQRVSLHDLSGVETVQGALVLSIDEAPAGDSFGLPGGQTVRGLVVAVERGLVPRLLSTAGAEARGPTVHLVLDPTPARS